MSAAAPIDRSRRRARCVVDRVACLMQSSSYIHTLAPALHVHTATDTAVTAMLSTRDAPRQHYRRFVPIGLYRTGASFSGCWRGLWAPNVVKSNSCTTPKAESGHQLLLRLLDFSSPKMHQNNIFLQLRRTMGELTALPLNTLSWWGGGFLGNAAPPQEPYPVPALSCSGLRLHFRASFHRAAWL